MENRNLLLFGTTFKAIGIAFALWYVVNGHLPADYLINLLVVDIIWLPLFAIILLRLYGWGENTKIN